MGRWQLRMFSMAVGLIGIVGAAIPVLADDSLEANVQARLQKVEALHKDYDKTIAEGITGTPELQKISAAKAKYVLDQYGLLTEAQSKTDDAQLLHDNQKKLMDGCNKELEPLIHALPAVAKLEDINIQIGKIDGNYTATRGRVVDAVQAATDVQDLSDRIAPLKARAAALQDRILTLQNLVNGQKDAGVKAHNQDLLDKAGALMKELQGQIDALNKASLAANLHVINATGIANRQQALAAIERIRAGWNRASQKRDEALAALSELRDVRVSISMTSFGTVSLLRLDGQTIPMISGQEIVVHEGETIHTGPNSGATISYINGSKQELGANTTFTEFYEITIENQRYLHNPKFNGGTIHELNLLWHDAQEYRIIRTPSSVCAVRGTDYVLHTDEKETQCYLASGEVELKATAPGAKPVTLKPMQRATLKAGEVEWKIDAITADDYERQLSSLDPPVN